MFFLRRCVLLVLPLLLVNGCFGNRSVPEEPSSPILEVIEEKTSEPVPPPPVEEPVAPIPPMEPPPSAPEPEEAPKPNPIELVPPQPEPAKETIPEVEPAPKAEETPSPVVEETPPQAETQPGVNGRSPVNALSPVKQGSPVQTQSPVRQGSPVKQAEPLGFRFLPRAALLFAAMLLAEETPTIPAELPPALPIPAPKTTPPIPEATLPIPAPETPPIPAANGDAAPGSAPAAQTPYPDITTLPVAPATLPIPAPEPAVPIGEKRLRFNFRHVPWKDVIEWFAEQAELSLQADNVPSGTLNLTDNKYYTPTEALDILNSYLLFKEYTIIRKGKSLFVIFLPDGIPPNLLEPILPSELDERGKYEICRCVFTLIRTTPDVIQNEVDKLLGPQGSLVTLPKSQQLVITETAGTLRTIRDIIQRIDDPTGLDSGAIQIIELQNIFADEGLGIMRRLLSIDESDQNLRTAIDATGTKIWMTGRSDMVERAKEMINSIDASFQSKSGTLEGQPQFEIYDAGIADPVTVLAVLQTLLAGTPDVRLSLDARTNGIAVLGRPANHATVKETIRQMQLSGSTFDVIPLTRLSPTSAVESIKRFFATATVDSSTTTANRPTGIAPPIVEADIAARQIIVRGTASQIAEVRAFLLKLGEDGTGGRAPGSETIRSIPLSPAVTALVIDQIKDIWPRLQDNEIRVVTPSAIVPMRSTSELKGPGTPTPPTETPEIDTLIDETFEKTTPGPSTLRLSKPVRYLPVQFPVYQPIQAEQPKTATTQPNEIDELKRQIAELTQVIETLTTKTPPVETTSAAIPQPPAPKPNAPVVISSGPTGLMISSEDPEALDKLEDLIRMLSDETVLGKTSLAVYYLKHSTAEVVAQTLQTLMGAARTSVSGVSGTGTVNTSAVFENESALFGLIGLGQSIASTGPVTVTAEPRLNALLVQANPIDHNTIEKLLPILDQAELPDGDPKIKAEPRPIALKNMRAEDAQAVVEKVYAARLQGAGAAGGGGQGAAGRGARGGTGQGQAQQPQQAQQQPQTMIANMPPGMMQGGPGGFIQAMMSQMGRGGATGGRAAALREAEPTMTLAVDSRSNSLIVFAPQSLFLEVEQFVKELDAMAVQNEIVTEVVPLQNISPELAQQTLRNAIGNNVLEFSQSRPMQSGGGFGGRGGVGGFGTGGLGGMGTGGMGIGGLGGTGGMGGTGFGGNRGMGASGGAANPFLNMMRGGAPFGGMGGGTGLGGNRATFGGGR